MAVTVRLQAEPFDPGAETNAFLTDTEGMGAAVTFTGLVRSTPGDPVQSLTLEHYPDLAQKQIERFAEQAIKRFELRNIIVIHRFGRMLPGEPIVQVMALAAHRQAAFDGANFVMDWLKTDAPFWKKEETSEGQNWVEARAADDAAKEKWRK